jgi:hypothetical protein
MGGIMPKSHIAWNKGLKGYKRPIWVGKKISKAKKGKKFYSSSQFKVGYIPWNKDKTGLQIPWNKNKRMPQTSGKLNHNWKGGITNIAYGKEFTDELKLRIRQRDNFICQVCNKTNCKLHIHHIDYNKKNNKENNLIALCESCHYKTFYHREKWITYFNR